MGTQKMNSFILLYLIMLSGYNGQAQTKVIDSLRKVIEYSPSNNARLKNLLAICAQYYSLSTDSSDIFAKQAKAIAYKTGDLHAERLADYYIALNFLTAGNSDSSLELASAQLKNISYTSDKEVWLKLSFLKARSLNNTDHIKESLALTYSLLNQAEKEKDVLSQISALTLMEGSYVAMGEDLHAQELCYKVLSIVNNGYPVSWANDVCVSIENLCLTYMHLNENKGAEAKMDSAIKYNELAINLGRKYELLSVEAYNLGLKGTLLGYANKLAEGEEALKQSLAIYRRIKNKFYIVNCLSMLGNFYGTTNQPLKGIEVCKEGLELSKGSRPNLFIYYNLAGNYKLAGNYLEYGNTMSKLLEIKDSMYKVNSAEALSTLQTQYEVQKKENLIIQQKLDINKKNNLIYGSLVLLALTLIAGWLLFALRKKNQSIRLGQMQMKERKNTMEGILQAEENERKRIAADLHDSVAQKMVVAKLNLETLEHYLPGMNTEQQNVYNNILSLVDESCTDVRSMSHSMMPHAFFKEGLPAAVKNFINKIENKNFKVNVNVEGEPDNADNNTQIMVYRIIQECVQNVLKHSKATVLDISMIYAAGEMDITIEDNGNGFDTPLINEGIGMKNIRSRIGYLNGTVDIQSTVGTGTALTFYIPAKQF